MAERGIARDVQRFVHEHLTSVAQLEILLLLHDKAGEEFSAEEIAEMLRIDPAWAEAELSRLASRGMFSKAGADPPRYSFNPARPGDAGVVADLSRVFSTHRVSVITLIFSRPSDSVGSFADAFKLRSNDDG